MKCIAFLLNFEALKDKGLMRCESANVFAAIDFYGR